MKKKTCAYKQAITVFVASFIILFQLKSIAHKIQNRWDMFKY